MDSNFQKLHFPNVASWRNNPRLSTGRANKEVQSANVLPATETGVPQPVRGVRVQAKKTDNGTQITLSHTNVSDPAHSHVDVWVKGFLGNTQPVKVSSGTSPHTFLLPTTGENISLHVQSIGKDGSVLPINQAPAVATKL